MEINSLVRWTRKGINCLTAKWLISHLSSIMPLKCYLILHTSAEMMDKICKTWWRILSKGVRLTTKSLLPQILFWQVVPPCSEASHRDFWARLRHFRSQAWPFITRSERDPIVATCRGSVPRSWHLSAALIQSGSLRVSTKRTAPALFTRSHFIES